MVGFSALFFAIFSGIIIFKLKVACRNDSLLTPNFKIQRVFSIYLTLLQVPYVVKFLNQFNVLKFKFKVIQSFVRKKCLQSLQHLYR